VLATSPGSARDSALRLAADLLDERAGALLAANQNDVAASEGSFSPAQIDRLRLNDTRLRSMSDAMREVAALPDVVGEVLHGYMRPNGLRIERVRVPLGVIGIIYENRPNVTADAAGLCLKSANAVMLRGSSSAIESNKVIASCIRDALAKSGLPQDAVVLVEDTSREAAIEFMKLDGLIDCLIPRGGHSLVSSVKEHASVPVVIDGDGNCHVYVDASADLDMALEIVVNAKTQRPGVCNAMETLVVHKGVAKQFLPRVRSAMGEVELLGNDAARSVLPEMKAATDEDFATEFLDLKLSVAVVDDLDAAIGHIARFSSGHSEAVVTGDLEVAERFCKEVDAAAVLVNASTRFVDGAEIGLGAEIGISTQKMHARGPMGLRELTTVKYVIHGDGQVRR
jgi:glutamate-5-semialdehyde dehydrogenase